MRIFGLLLRLLALTATLTLAQAQAPAPRMALIIGNAGYSFGALKNPKNDAKAMGEALEEAGFDVTVATDVDRAAMAKAVEAFGAKLKSTGGVGLFYFSGHGAQISGENYLIPVSVDDAEEVKGGSVTATEIVNVMAGAHKGLNIFILDACRTNPFDPNGAHGLSRIDSNASLFVSYATSPGAVALDGAGHNSPYTKYLSEWIATPNLSIEDTFKRTLKGVYVDTHGEQTPWISSTFFGDFVFHPDGAEAEEEDDQASEGEDDEEAEAPTLTGVYRTNGTNPSGSKYTGIVAIEEDGDDFKLTWWIGKDVFHGSGHFAGKMLVINWGDKTPVTYSFGDEGELDGEWADGSASETLTPVGDASDEDVSPPEGEYAVEGRNAEGKDYEGIVTITKSRAGYHLKWEVDDGSQYEGEGKLVDNLLTVDWGGTTPMVYALADDGSLTGLWESGHAEETLTPEQ